MRVAFVDPFGLYGLAHYNFCLAQALAERGVDVVMLTSVDYELASWPRRFRLRMMARTWAPLSPDNLRAGRHPFTRLKKMGRYSLAMMHLIKGVVQEKAHIAHFAELYFPVDLPALWALKGMGVKLVNTVHNVRWLSEGLTARFPGRILQREIYRCFDALIFHTHHSRQEFVEAFGRMPKHSRIIPHGNYLFHRPESIIPREEARLRLGLKPQDRVCLFFGVLRRYKGLPVLLEAFAEVQRQLPRARLLIAGAPYFDADVEGLRRRAEELKLDVLWDLRYIPAGELPLYFSACDLVVLPYERVYQSGVLQLAFAFARPVVVTEVGGLPEVVKQGETGLIVPPRDEKALARAILHLLSNPDLACRMGRRGLLEAETLYDWGHIAATVEELYREVLRAREK